MIRVVLPAHLRTLARVDGEVKLDVEGPVTQRSVLDALEARYPMLRGTIRDHVTQRRRAFVRFFACEQDLSDLAVKANSKLAPAAAVLPVMLDGIDESAVCELIHRDPDNALGHYFKGYLLYQSGRGGGSAGVFPKGGSLSGATALRCDHVQCAVQNGQRAEP